MRNFLIIIALLIASSAVAHAESQGTWWAADDGTWSLIGPATSANDESRFLLASGCTSLEVMP